MSLRKALVPFVTIFLVLVGDPEIGPGIFMVPVTLWFGLGYLARSWTKTEEDRYERATAAVVSGVVTALSVSSAIERGLPGPGGDYIVWVMFIGIPAFWFAVRASDRGDEN